MNLIVSRYEDQTNQECKTISEQQCNQVTRQECKDVPEQVCKDELVEKVERKCKTVEEQEVRLEISF